MRADPHTVKALILRALAESARPLGALQISQRLLAAGLDLQPRTIRHHLLQLDANGLTRLVSRRQGRAVTERGRQTILTQPATDTPCAVSSRMDQLAYRMSFDPATGRGSLIYNVSLVDASHLATALREVQLAMDRGLSVGKRITITRAGQPVAGMVVPDGMAAIGTICSASLNGIFQKDGIPIVSRFAGLLEVRDRQYTRFLNMIEYRGTTLDPLEIFIMADMTRVRDVVLRGSGVICASFREVPAVAMDHLRQLDRKLADHGVGGILALGRPGRPLFDVPVAAGYCGLVISGGLNPIASVKESGIRVSVHSLAGLEDAGAFITIREAMRRS